MTGQRARVSLRAKLSPDRMSVLCGRCGGPIAYVAMVRDEYRDGSGWGEPYRMLRFDAGWRIDERGVWVFPRRALEQLARGRSPYRHPQWWREPAIGLYGGTEPARLPLSAVCPSCRSKQVLDATVLDVRSGDARDEAIIGTYLIVPGRRPAD
ncbi:hypothetical protein BH23CHL8_BH23CHL8_28810 [soil metagenome]